MITRRMFLLAGLALVSSASSLSSGCARRSASGGEGYGVSVETIPAPPRVGEGRLLIRILDPEGRPLAGATVAVEGTMAHAGMASVFARMEAPSEPGVYPGKLDWSMGGDWILIVQVTPPGQEPFERRLEVRGVRAD